MKYKALGVIGAVLLVLLTAPSTLGQTTTGVEGKPTPNAGITTIGRTYIWWNPSVIFAGSVTHLHAGVSAVPILNRPYFVRVAIYDPYPTRNGRPVIVLGWSSGCRPVREITFTYDYARRAWVLHLVCDEKGRIIYGIHIIARWRPEVPGIYIADIRVCPHELFDFPLFCRGSLATLEVRRIYR